MVIWSVLSPARSASAAWCDDQGHQHAMTEKEVGSVHFRTPAPKMWKLDIQLEPGDGTVSLFSLGSETRCAFEAVAVEDSTCAIADWGIAMSHYHGLWENGNTAAGRVAREG